MAMKKKAPKKSEPKPPTPRQTAMTSTKPVAKKANPATAMGRQAAAKSMKETSAVTRAKAAAYKKSGAEYMKTGSKSMSGDLGGPNWQQVKGFKYGSPEFRRSRTEQRALDQDKRAKTKSGKGYLRKGPDTFSSPAYLSKANDLAGVEPFGIGKNKMGRTAKRGIDQAKRKKRGAK